MGKHFSTAKNNSPSRESAVDISAAALRRLTEKLIEQKALDVSKQVEIYLATHPPIAGEEINRDSTLAQIAFEPVGQTGYTALYEQGTGIARFHPNPKLTNFDMHNWSEKLPSWWKVYGASLDGSSIGGYYEWEDADGKIRPKYMHCAPVKGRNLVTAATIYLNEFLKPCREIQSKLISLERRVEQQTMAEWLRAERLQAINDISRKICSMLDLDKLLSYGVNCIQETLQYHSVNIFLLDPDSDKLILKAGAGGWRGMVPIGLSLKVDDGVAGRVIQTRKALVVNDVNQESKHHLAGADIQSRLLAPIKIGSEVLGVLEIGSAKNDVFDEMELCATQTLADHIAIAINNARLYQETYEMAGCLKERSRTIKGIHDSVAQGFINILSQLEAAELALGEDISSAQKYIDQARSLARQSLNKGQESDTELSYGGGLSNTLSMQELKVLSFMAKGPTNKQIAAKLFISQSTVKTHINSIFHKLGVDNRTEAVTQALKKGIILL